MESVDVRKKKALEFFKLKEGYTEEELKAAYHKLAREFHPDLHPESEFEKWNEKMQEVNSMYSILNDLLKEKNNEPQAKPKPRDFKDPQKQLLKDIDNLLRRYAKNPKIKNCCNLYKQKTEKVKSFEELMIIKEEFEKKVENIKRELFFEAEKRAFSYELEKLAKDNTFLSNIGIKNLNLLNDINNLKDLKALQDAYKKEFQEAYKKYEKERILKLKESFLKELKLIESLDINEDIKTLVNETIKDLNGLDTYADIKTLETDFKLSYNEIKKSEKEFLKKKQSVIQLISEYQSNKDPAYQNLAFEYIPLIENSTTMEEIRENEKNFADKIKKLNAIKKQKNTQLLLEKNNLKKALSFKFSQQLTEYTFNNMKMVLELYRDLIMEIEKLTYENKELLTIIIDKIDFRNIQEEKSKMEFYRLASEKNFQKPNELIKVLKLASEPDETNYEATSEIRKQAKEAFFKKYIKFVTSASTSEIVNAIPSLNDVLNTIEQINENEISKNMSIFNMINIKDSDQTDYLLDTFRPASKFFIELKTGEIFTMDLLKSNECLLTPLDSAKGIKIVPFAEQEKDYITVSDFFYQANFVTKEPLNLVSESRSKRQLYSDEKTPLYFYDRLMLNYLEPLNDNPGFAFELADYKWKLGTASRNNNKIYRKYDSKALCKNDFVKQLVQELEKEKEKEDTPNKINY